MLSSRTITAAATDLVTAVLLSTPSAHTVVVGPTGERASRPNTSLFRSYRSR